MNGVFRLDKSGIVSAAFFCLVLAAAPPSLFAEEASQVQTAPVTEQKTDKTAVTEQKTDQETVLQQKVKEQVPAMEQKTRRAPASEAPVSELKTDQTPSTIQYRAIPEQPDTTERSGKGLISKNETLTLDRCIEIALTKNPSVVAAANVVDVSRSRVGEARSGYYPQVSAVGRYDRNGSDLETTSTVFSATTTTSTSLPTKNVYSGTVMLDQNILDFGRTSSSVDAAKYTLASSRSDLTATETSVVLNVKEAYYGVLQAKRNRDVAADVLKQFQLHLEQAQGFYDVGTKAKIDVIKAEVDLSNAKLSLINSENALKVAWVTLNNAMGVPDAPNYGIEDNLSFQQYTITLEEAISKAFENRPDLKSVVAKRQAAEANVGYARSGYFPILSGNASYTRSETDVPLNREGANSWDVGVTLTIPLFSGFLTSHQVAEAKSQLYVLKANEEAIKQQILLEVRQAYLNLQAAEASISTAELASKQAKENLDLANGRYSAGVGSPIEVSDAFATYVSAEANYTSALANYKIAQATIEKAMGMQ